jgi:sugar/nucleoside kinase (ribokinase family)
MLVTVGDLADDVVVWMREPVRAGTDAAAEIRRRRGGSAANVAAFAASAGVPARFIGRVGEDAVGRALVDELASAGVDVRVQRVGRTGTIVVIVDPAGERSFLTDRGAAADLAEVPDAWLDGVTWLHVPAYALQAGALADTASDLAAEAHGRGATVSVDASSVAVLAAHGLVESRRWLAAVAPHVLFANADEAAFLELHELAGRPHHAWTIVKQGPGPVLVYDPDGGDPVEISVPGATVVRDATGAGDALAAGFVAGRLAGLGIEPAVRRGIELARRVLSNPGAAL